MLDPFDIIIALVLLFLSYAIRAARLAHYFYLSQTSELLGCIRLMLIHNFWNNLIPMRIGEASFPILMKKQFNIPFEKSLPALLWFRVLDLHSLLFILLVAFSASLLKLSLETTLIIGALWLCFPPTLFIFQQKIQKAIGSGTKLSQLATKILIGLPQRRSQFLWSWFWTQINWVIKLLALAWILIWFIDLTFAQSLLGVIGGELTSVLPIHGLGGFGTYEAGVWFALNSFDSQQGLIITSAINLHLMVLSSSLLSAIIAQMLPKR
jgi:hypothetical protein